MSFSPCFWGYSAHSLSILVSLLGVELGATHSVVAGEVRKPPIDQQNRRLAADLEDRRSWARAPGWQIWQRHVFKGPGFSGPTSSHWRADN